LKFRNIINRDFCREVITARRSLLMLFYDVGLRDLKNDFGLNICILILKRDSVQQCCGSGYGAFNPRDSG
jgi:hypothetical protein